MENEKKIVAKLKEIELNLRHYSKLPLDTKVNDINVQNSQDCLGFGASSS